MNCSQNDLTLINPLNYNQWNEHLLDYPESTFFHTANWAKVLQKTYDYNPVYFVSIKNGRLAGLLPVMEIKSLLTGKRGVSLPFTDNVAAIFENKQPFEEALKKLRHYGTESSWKTLELRGADNFLSSVEPSASYYFHHLKLSGTENELFSNLRDSTKRNIKKSIKSGVKVRISTSQDALNYFYLLNRLTRKKHGLPPQPFAFFENIYKYVLSEKLGIIVTAFYQEIPIASAVFFHFGKTVIYKYGSSDHKYQHLRANNLVMWRAICWYLRFGYEELWFGRTAKDNHGLRQFKSGWGGEEKIIKYYKFDFNKNEFISNSFIQPSKLTSTVFSKTPVFLLNGIGKILYKHIG